jgi:hypothetical protein
VGIQRNEIGFKAKDVKRLLGLEVHQDGVKKADFSRVMEYNGFDKIRLHQLDGQSRRKDLTLLCTTT